MKKGLEGGDPNECFVGRKGRGVYKKKAPPHIHVTDSEKNHKNLAISFLNEARVNSLPLFKYAL